MDTEWKNSLSKADLKKPTKTLQLRVLNEIEAGVSQGNFEECVDLLLGFTPKSVVPLFYRECFASWPIERKSEWTRTLTENNRLCANSAGWGTDRIKLIIEARLPSIVEVSEVEAELRWLVDHPYKNDATTMKAIRKHGNPKDVCKLFSIEREHWGDEWERLCILFSMMMQDCEEQSLIIGYSEFLARNKFDLSSIPTECISKNMPTVEMEKEDTAKTHESLNGVQLATELLQWVQASDNELLGLNREIADLQLSIKRSERERKELQNQYSDISTRFEELRKASDAQCKEINALTKKCSNLKNDLAASYRIDKSLVRQELDELRHSIKGAIRLDIKELYGLKPEDTDWYDIVMACAESITEALDRHGIHVGEER